MALSGFTVREYVGGEVYLLDPEGEPIEQPLTKREDLRPGLAVVVPTLFGYARMRIEESVPSKELYAEGEHTVASLDFAGDDRGCWTSSMVMNKAAMKKAKETTCTR